MSKEDLERMKALEEKRDNCTITEIEEKELTYLIWKYTNQDFEEYGRTIKFLVSLEKLHCLMSWGSGGEIRI